MTFISDMCFVIIHHKINQLSIENIQIEKNLHSFHHWIDISNGMWTLLLVWFKIPIEGKKKQVNHLVRTGQT